MQQHTWSFSTVGGEKRVNLDSGADLVHLGELDQKLWTALSCPVEGLEIDQKTLELIDQDKDGKIRVPEILAAVNWMVSVLRNPDDLLKQDPIFPLSAIQAETEEGKKLYASALVILKNLGKSDSTTLTVEETSNTTTIFAAAKFNGDGVITEQTCEGSNLISLFHDIVACVGSVPDLSGSIGINEDLVSRFAVEGEAYLKWYDKSASQPSILPFGEQTEEAYLAYTQLFAKVQDYFIRCRLAAFDPQSTSALNLSVERVQAISPKDLSEALGEIAAYPLAKVDAGKPLPLTSGINPAWESAMANFVTLVIKPLFQNKELITEPEWNSLEALFAPYVQWKSEKEGTAIEPLGPARIREIMQSHSIAEIEALIQQDMALAEEANNIMMVDQLVRYHRDLFRLLKNFVTFYDFYSPGSKAIFQAGTLYIDQRSCDLCIKVSDMAKHSRMVSFSGMFLIYCECSSRSSNEKMIIAAALTNGDIDNLVEGRNALFYDRHGNDWDATVIKIVDNPISIRQAFWSPYRKVSRFVEKQVNKFAAEQDDKVTSNATKNIEETQTKIVSATPDAPPPKAPAQPFDVGKFVGIFAAISLALGAIGTAIAHVVTGFMGLMWWKMPFAVLGVILLISGPSMILAYLKLRKRNLAPILDANGWAINANVIVNITMGNLLTHLADLPRGAKLNLNDPFSKKKRPFWPFAILGLCLIFIILYWLWRWGLIHINI